jgi:hypothetical protein
MTRKEAFGTVCDFLLEHSGEKAFMLSEDFIKARDIVKEIDEDIYNKILAVIYNSKNEEVDVSILVKKK